jgi:hypothetical protein
MEPAPKLEAGDVAVSGTLVPTEKKVSAVITISDADESPERAIQSIIENPQFFADVHLVKHGYSSQYRMYDGWADDLEMLITLGLSPVWHSKLEPSKLRTRAIVDIEPDLWVADGALTTLLDDIEANPTCDHFAVSSLTTIALPDGGTPRMHLESLSYGFLIVILVLDTLRSIGSLFQIHRTVDLRARLLTATYPNRVRVAPYRWWVWWFGTGVSTTKKAGYACIQIPAAKDQGIEFVLRTIKTHRYMGVGMWTVWYTLYYAIFAWPFWNTFLMRSNWWVAMWLLRDMRSPWWISIYVGHTALVGYITLRYLKFPRQEIRLLQIVLYTFYLTASPLVFLYGRFYQSAASWTNVTESLMHPLNYQKKKKP